MTMPTSSQCVTRSRMYRCQCGRPVFFANSVCLACGTPLGYEPQLAQVVPLQPWSQPETWVFVQESQPPRLYKRCANFLTAAGCNWLVPLSEVKPYGQMCTSCRLNHIVPDTTGAQHPDNATLWNRIEVAKRRVIAALVILGLPVQPKVGATAHCGLMFDVLRPHPNDPPVMTGHGDGLITLNLEEADDATRESTRKVLREPYRTLLGHLRHEVGHYYWERLVRKSPWHESFGTVFGDEQQDYAASLARYYERGPLPDWARCYVSAYASAHPLEDWAETWAHYLHMCDALDTAHSFGINPRHANLEFIPFTLDDLYRCQDPGAERFLGFLNDWVELATKLNEMSRSMGQPDFYPFVLSRVVVAKLHFIHLVVSGAN